MNSWTNPRILREFDDLGRLDVIVRRREDLFAETGRGAAEDSSPATLADLALAETRALGRDPGALEIVVLEDRSIDVCDRPAFFLHLRIESPSGLEHDHLRAGFVRDSMAYWIWFRAPTLSHFGRDRPAFDHAVATIQPRMATIHRSGL